MKPSKAAQPPAFRACPRCGAVKPKPGLSGSTELTNTQLQVARLIAVGYTAKQVAAELDMSHRTAEYHRYAILKRLQLRTLAELTIYAMQNGLIQVD